jgi:hypothetical protein
MTAAIITRPDPLHVGRVEALRCEILRRHLLLQGTAQAADAATTATIAGLLMFKTTQWRSPSELAMALVLTLLPAVLSVPIAWHVADKPRRQAILGRTHVVRSIICLAGLLVVPTASQTVGFVLIGLMPAAQAVSSSVRAAALPYVVPSSRLVAANSLCTLVAKAAGCTGALLAVTLGHFDPTLVFVTAATLHLLAAGGYLTWRADLGGRAVDDPTGPRLRRAWTNVVHHEHASASALLAIATRCLLGAEVMLLAINGDRRYGLGPAGYAGAIGICATGVFCGSVVGPSWSRRTGGRRWARRAVQLAVVAALVASLTPTLGTAATAVFLFSAAFGALRNRADATVMTAVHDLDRGRFFALYDATYQVAYLLGAVAAAVSPLARHPLGLGAVTAVAVTAAAVISTRRSSGSERSTKPC